jgi:hydroxymethylglutaryl-CoA lyase
MATDIRIAAHPDVTFTMSETRLGVVPAVISKCASSSCSLISTKGAADMVREWGIAKAREAMILARAVKCQELLPVGGVHHITQNQEEAMKLAYELADQLAGNAPGAINNAKEICKTAAEQIEATHDARAKEAFLEFAAPSKEAQFGIQAFREKRKADWSQLE